MAWVAIGRFGRPHGVRGEVRFWPYNPATELVVAGALARVGNRPDSARALRITDARRDAKSHVVRFAEVTDRDEVGALTGQVWYAEREVFPAPGGDEVYVVDLIGLPVRTTEGVALGHLSDIRALGGGEMLVIRDGARERLVPNVDAFVERLDPAAGEVVIRPIEGLLEDL